MNPPSPLDPPPLLLPRRRWFRVSLRGLMVLVLVIGGGIGWKVNKVRTQRLAVEAIRAAGGTVLYDYQFSTDPERIKLIRKVKEPSAPGWLRRWLGDDFFQTAASVRFPKAFDPEAFGMIAKLDGLLSIQFENTSGMQTGWSALTRLTRLKEVFLIGSGVTDAVVAVISEIPSVEKVRFSKAPVSDSGIAVLAKLPKLRSLTLGSCNELSDSGLARLLDHCSPLEEFAWSQSPGPVLLTVQALAAHHRGLRRLSFIQSTVEDGDLAPIAGLTGLKLLNLQQTRVTDAGLIYLEPLVNLESLWVNLPGVTDAGTKSLGKLKNLEILDLKWSKVGDPGLSELGRLTKLKFLDLRETKITDVGAETLGRLASLESLSLMHTNLTDAAMGPLQKLKKLERLSVGGTAITPEGLAGLRTTQPALSVLTQTPQPKTGSLPIPRN